MSLESAETSQSREFGDRTRRTYLAAERTLLVWWRTSFAAVAVALAVGRLLPEVAHLPRDPFLGLGVGWGVLAAALLVVGSTRQRRGHRAIKDGDYLHLDQRKTTLLGAYMLVLTVATVSMLFWTS